MADHEATIEPSGVDETTPDTTHRGPRHSKRRFRDVCGAWLGSDRRMFLVLGVVALAWVIILGRLILMRHNHFATFDFDEGIQDQLIWQLAHFRQFTTVRGVPFLGNHASFGFVLLAPLAWLGAGPNVWNLINVVALASGAMVLYLIARDKVGRPWLSLLVGLVWLAQPTVQWWVWEGFHPECVALPFLFATYLFGERILARKTAGKPVERRLQWWFVGSFVATIIWKEDLALALLGMGLVWLVRRQWKFALQVIAVAALWFALFGAWMVPHYAKGTVYGGIYGGLGKTPSQVLTTSARHPSRLVDRLDDNDAVGYTRQLHQSFGFISVLSPATWLIGAPQWTINIISTADFTWDMKFHYQAIPIAALAISFVEGISLLYRRRRWLGEGAIFVGLVAALYCARVYGPGPWSEAYRVGYWPHAAPQTQSAYESVVRSIPDGQGVAADYNLVPHLTHRQIIYTFPNPWLNSNYGIDSADHGNRGGVRWIALDEAKLNERDASLLASIEASNEFRVVSKQGRVILLERVKPPGKGTRPIVLPAG